MSGVVDDLLAMSLALLVIDDTLVVVRVAFEAFIVGVAVFVVVVVVEVLLFCKFQLLTPNNFLAGAPWHIIDSLRSRNVVKSHYRRGLCGLSLNACYRFSL